MLLFHQTECKRKSNKQTEHPHRQAQTSDKADKECMYTYRVFQIRQNETSK